MVPVKTINFGIFFYFGFYQFAPYLCPIRKQMNTNSSTEAELFRVENFLTQLMGLNFMYEILLLYKNPTGIRNTKT